MRIYKQSMEPKRVSDRNEIVLGDKDMNEIILVDDIGSAFHISSDGVGIEIRCPEGVVRILPHSSNMVTVTNVPFTGR